MTAFESFLISLNYHINGLDFLPTLLFVCVLMVTYGWSNLGDKIKLVLFFTCGVVLYGGFFDQLINRYLFPDLHSYVPLILGSITAGLLELGSVLISNRIMIVGIFFGGAVLPLFLAAHLGFFEFAVDSIALPLIIIVCIAIFGGVAMLRITQKQLFQMLVSATGGAFAIVYLTGWPYALADWGLIDTGSIKALNHMMQNHARLFAVCLAGSGIIVQSLVRLALRRKSQGLDIEPLANHASEQVRIREQVELAATKT